MPRTKLKANQFPIELDPNDDTAYQAFLRDLKDHPPPVKTSTVRRWKSHKEKPCANPELVFVEVRGMNKGRIGYRRCVRCGMFHEWVGPLSDALDGIPDEKCSY